MLPVAGLSREWDQPIWSQSRRVLKEPTANSWPSGDQDMAVTGHLFFLCHEMVFCYQNCSDLLWEKKCPSDWEKLLKFEAGGREFANVLRSLEQFIETVKGQNNFW